MMHRPNPLGGIRPCKNFAIYKEGEFFLYTDHEAEEGIAPRWMQLGEEVEDRLEDGGVAVAGFITLYDEQVEFVELEEWYFVELNEDKELDLMLTDKGVSIKGISEYRWEGWLHV